MGLIGKETDGSGNIKNGQPFHGGCGACVACWRVLQSMEPTVVRMSMKEILQFERSIPNPAGIEWVIGSGADVGADLYMVAPVGSTSVPSPSALYELDPTTGEATILGGLGVEDPMDMAWENDRSTMYLIDKDSDALYTVRQIQAPSPPPPTTPEIGTEHIGRLTLFTAPATTISKPRGLAWVKTVPPMDSIYMVDDDTDALYTVNTTTGVAGRVGNGFRIVDANDRVRGLAWGRGPGSDNQQGQHLYLLTDSALYRMNRGLGTADKIGSGLGVSDAAGLAWDGRDEDDGGRVMYMVNGGSAPALYTVNTTTGVATRQFLLPSSTLPSGLAWAESTLYVSTVTGELYEIDTSTGSSRGTVKRVGDLGIDEPTAFAWDKDSSIMYTVDEDTNSLYKVTGLLRPYLPNAGDLYYNGGNFADAVMRWDNPSWSRVEDCNTTPTTEDTDCSTYEHDLELEWDNPESEDNPQGWFTVGRTRIRIEVPFFSFDLGSYPGRRVLGRVIPYDAPAWPQLPPSPSQPYALPLDLFCTTWSDLPRFYNDCHTAGVGEVDDKVILAFGSYKANSIEPGRDYYGYWSFNNQIGTGSVTDVNLYGQEGRFGEDPDASFLRRIKARFVCPVIRENKWCVFGIDGRQAMLSPYEDGSTWEWTYDESFYGSYER